MTNAEKIFAEAARVLRPPADPLHEVRQAVGALPDETLRAYSLVAIDEAEAPLPGPSVTGMTPALLRKPEPVDDTAALLLRS